MQEWLDLIKQGMYLIYQGCHMNKTWTNCQQCPLDEYCDYILLGAGQGWHVDIPENWYDE